MQQGSSLHDPKSLSNHLMLGGSYQLAGDFERAKDEYKSAG